MFDLLKKRNSRKELLSRIESLEKELDGRRDDIRRLNDRIKEYQTPTSETTDRISRLVRQNYDMRLKESEYLAEIDSMTDKIKNLIIKNKDIVMMLTEKEPNNAT